MHNRHIRMSQTFLFEVMEALGYLYDEDGVCFGIALMGIQAILTEEITALDARLEAASNEPLETLCKDPDPNLLAFFDGVMLYQSPAEFPNILGEIRRTQKQMVLAAQPLLTPEKLKNFQKINAFTGIYNREELIYYFQSLHLFIKTKARPFAILMTTLDHAITLSFDHANQSWVLIDANQLPYRYFSIGEEALLVKRLHPDLTNMNSVGLISTIYCAGADTEYFQKPINDWKETGLTDILSVTAEKTELIDIYGNNWLYFAIENDEFDSVYAIAQLNQLTLRQHIYEASIHIAASLRKCTALNALLKAGLDPNYLSDERETKTALHIAIINSDLFMIELLTAYMTIDLNVKDSYGNTPLQLARKKFEPNHAIITHLVEYEKQLAAAEQPSAAKRKKVREEESDTPHQYSTLFDENKENRVNFHGMSRPGR